MTRAIVLLALLAGCYSPRIDRCKITCTDACPSAQRCLDDGFCHADGDDLLCTPDAEPGDLDADPTVIDAEVPGAVFQVLTAGGHHVCAIDADHGLWCWGYNRASQLGVDELTMRRSTTPIAVGAGQTWTAVDAGDDHTCAIADGHLYCWGANYDGQAIDQTHGGGDVREPEENDNGPTGGWLEVATGARHVCAIHDDGGGARSIWCAGQDDAGQLGNGGGDDSGPTLVEVAATSDGEVTDWTSLVTTGDHTCALRPTGEAYCWGKNVLGQIGDNSVTSPRSTPTRVAATLDDGVVPFAAIATGDVATCAIGKGAFAGRLYCWGSNGYGQFGSTMLSSATQPRRIGLAEDWATVTMGWLATCGTRSSSGVSCWGEGSYGIVGQGSFSYESTPAAVAGLNVPMLVTTGYEVSCAAPPTGGVKCWGANVEGELGNGETSTKHVPAAVGVADGQWTDVAAGNAHTCAVHAGVVQCWGRNEDGEVAGTTGGEVHVPTDVAGLTGTATEVSVSRYASCAILDGKPWCWGANMAGEVGVAGTIGALVPPTQLSSSGTWSALTQTQDASCALLAGDRWCWGNGSDFGFGNSSGSMLPTPQLVDGPWDVHSLGYRFGCGVRATSSKLACWGSDAHSTQADGVVTHTDAATPHDIGSAQWLTVASAWSGDHACAIDTPGQDLWCWGRNDYGQLGLLAGAEKFTPTLVDAGTWSSVAAGPLHTCGIKAGELWCWGDQNYHQIGVDSAVSYYEAPVRIGDGADWTAVSAGAFHTCGLRGGNLYCWGQNLQGQLGDGTSAHATPVSVVFP